MKKINKEKRLNKIIKDLSKFPFVKAIYVFGSYAEGKGTPISDIDICVFDDNKYPIRERKKVYIYSEKPFDVSLFSDLSLPMRYEVLKGKKVFVRDEQYLYETKVKVLNEYFDMQWIWEENLRLRKEYGHRVITVG